MLSVEKEATPFTAATVKVPPRVPLLGFVPMAMVMEAVEDVTMLPCASSTATCTAGEMEAPAATFVGCVVKTSFVAAPAVTLKALLGPVVNPVAVADKV